MGLLLACSAAAEVPSTPSAAGGPGEDANAGNAGAPVHSGPDWCAARVVLQAKCQRCHGEPQENGAPFPLLSYADTQVVDRAGSPRSDKMKAALESDFMPPQFLKLTPEVEPLSDDERATLLDWLANEPPLDADCD
ncbi:MAG: hypothetical protein ABUL60_08850 [Myxococcales bacterium]